MGFDLNTNWDCSDFSNGNTKYLDVYSLFRITSNFVHSFLSFVTCFKECFVSLELWPWRVLASGTLLCSYYLPNWVVAPSFLGEFRVISCHSQPDIMRNVYCVIGFRDSCYIILLYNLPGKRLLCELIEVTGIERSYTYLHGMLYRRGGSG